MQRKVQRGGVAAEIHVQHASASLPRARQPRPSAVARSARMLRAFPRARRHARCGSSVRVVRRGVGSEVVGMKKAVVEGRERDVARSIATVHDDR